MQEVEVMLMDDAGTGQRSLKGVLQNTERNILKASTELKEQIQNDEFLYLSTCKLKQVLHEEKKIQIIAE